MSKECLCLRITMQQDAGHPYLSIDVNASGLFNGYNTYQWLYDGITYYMWHDATDNWYVTTSPIGDLTHIELELKLNTDPCPIDSLPNWVGSYIKFSTAYGDCECRPIEDRHERKFDAIRLPEVFEEQDRGFKICCDCPMLVLGGGTKSWENDITSSWIKLSSVSDSAAFVLKKDGIISSYTPLVYEFPNEENAFYTTIPWTDVLSQDGIGCYTLSIQYNISGIIGELMWGQYNLKPYSIDNALETARIRVKYNLQQEIEGINFTGANVEDCIRFNGFIGDRQPNMEIDNLTYQNRVVKTVVRENLDTFTIKTDPLMECFVSPMCNLFLLSENEMWISDYNAHNHSYQINDIPVIVEESPEIDYLDQFQRRAILSCVVGLRTKNRRTHY